jgi:hypothetical protein
MVNIIFLPISPEKPLLLWDCVAMPCWLMYGLGGLKTLRKTIQKEKAACIILGLKFNLNVNTISHKIFFMRRSSCVI